MASLHIQTIVIVRQLRNIREKEGQRQRERERERERDRQTDRIKEKCISIYQILMIQTNISLGSYPPCNVTRYIHYRYYGWGSRNPAFLWSLRHDTSTWKQSNIHQGNWWVFVATRPDMEFEPTTISWPGQKISTMKYRHMLVTHVST